MAGTFNDFWKTWKATLPTVQVDSESKVSGLTLTEGKMPALGMLHALTSQQNRKSAFDLLNVYTRRDGSHTKTVAKYKYQQRAVPADVTAGVPVSYCTAGKAPAWLDGEKEIAAAVSYKITVTDTDLMSVAKFGQESFNSMFNTELGLAYNAIATSMEELALGGFESNRGINLTTAATTPVTAEAFKSAADFTVNRAAGHAIRNEFRDQEYKGDIIAVGGSMFNDFVDESIQLPSYRDRSLMSGPQNDFLNNDGQAIARNMRGITAYDSQFAEDILVAAANPVAAWEPGTFQMLEAYDFLKPGLQMDATDYKKGTMVISKGGLPMLFDYVAKYEQCDSGALGWTWTITKKFDFWAFPKTDQYQATDRLFTTNSLALFNLTAGV